MIELIKPKYDTLQEAYNTGFTKGEHLGFENGEERGYMNGYEDGEEAGFTDGYEDGEHVGYENGYSVGFEDGVADEKANLYENHLVPDVDGYTDASYAFAGNCWTELKEPHNMPSRIYKSTRGMYMENKNLTDMWFWTHKTEDTNTDSNYMYCGCSNLERIVRFRTSPLETTAIETFKGCSSLRSIYALWFNKSVKTYKDMFKGCVSLASITAAKTIDGTGLDFSDCPLEVDSINSIISCLVKQPSGTTKTITFGATNLNKLTAAEKAVATGKGWTLK